jgi:membrane associated rhomboid family serine protease
MLDDRSYMRASRYRDPWKAVTWILVSTVAAFFVQSAIGFYLGESGETFLRKYVYLSADGIRHGHVWELLTFQFCHANLIHILLNCLAIYFAGRLLEEDLGASRFFGLYFLSGVAGGVFFVALQMTFPDHFQGGVLGASAGASGLLAAFALLHPDFCWFMFPIPFPIRAITLLMIDILWALYGVLFPTGNVADGAHLGGILYGMGFVYWGIHGNPAPWRTLFSRAPLSRPRASRPAFRGSVWPKPSGPPAPSGGAEFISREVDPILDKISAHGIHSLTEDEKRVLEAARSRMAKR